MNAPELSVTLKFRGVTIEGMTVEELRELRNLLDTIVGDTRVVEREYVPYRPWWEWRRYDGPYWTLTGAGQTTSGTGLRIDGSGITSASLTISCNSEIPK